MTQLSIQYTIKLTDDDFEDVLAFMRHKGMLVGRLPAMRARANANDVDQPRGDHGQDHPFGFSDGPEDE